MTAPTLVLEPGEPTTRPRARREAPEVRRQDLLRVTISCLARLGPKGTTGREICRQAGVSHSLLRHYFDNPNDLLLETYQQLSDAFVVRLEEEVAALDDPWRALERIFALHFSEEWAGPEVLGAWIGFWTLVRSRADFAEVRNAFNGRVTALITSVLRRIPLGPGAPAVDDAAAMIGGMMDGLWLEFGLVPSVAGRAKGVALCNAATRRLLIG